MPKMHSCTVYIADVNPLSNPDVFDTVYNNVSKDRKSAVDRYRFLKDKLLSLGAYSLLQYALKTKEKIEFIYGEYKKPYLKDGNLFFSLSHSGDYAVCAVSDCEIGCDIEKIAPADTAVAERFFSKGENNTLAQSQSESDKNDTFYRLWTLKESFLKATGKGLNLNLNEFEVDLDDLSLKQNADKRDFFFYEYGGVKGYKCAVCTAGKCEKVEFLFTDIKDLL